MAVQFCAGEIETVLRKHGRLGFEHELESRFHDTRRTTRKGKKRSRTHEEISCNDLDFSVEGYVANMTSWTESEGMCTARFILRDQEGEIPVVTKLPVSTVQIIAQSHRVDAEVTGVLEERPHEPFWRVNGNSFRIIRADRTVARIHPLSRSHEARCGAMGVVCLITKYNSAAVLDLWTSYCAAGGRGTRFIVLSATTQGAAAVFQITRALRQALLYQPDMILLTRGGGSTSDLDTYNSPAVIDAIEKTQQEYGVPVATAVGHTQDQFRSRFTVKYDFPTPTAAGTWIAHESPGRYLEKSQKLYVTNKKKIIGTLVQYLQHLKMRHSELCGKYIGFMRGWLSAVKTHSLRDM
jgi:hypothetical protein